MGNVVDLLAAIALSGAGFLSTSLDNLFLLVGFYTSPGYRIKDAALGYVAAIGLVVAVAYGLGNAADLAPAAYLGYLGIVPIAIGIKQLFVLIRERGNGPERGETASAGSFVSVLLVMLANSGDSLTVYLAIFADTKDGLEPVVLATALACALAVSGFAVWLVGRPGVTDFFRKVGKYVLPFLLIAVGLYVLTNTPTDTYLAH